MHAGDDEVEFGQSVFAQVHAAVAQDVALKSGKNADATLFLVERTNLAGEIDGAAFVQAVRHGQRLRVVGDGDVAVTQGASGLDHLFERAAPVALLSVHVQVAADIGQFEQHGQFAPFGGFDLARILAQFRRNPIPDRAPHKSPLRGREATTAPPSSRDRPYSFNVRPIPAARAAANGTLCSLLPVKYCSAAPIAFFGHRRAHPPGCLPARSARWPCCRRDPGLRVPADGR